MNIVSRPLPEADEGRVVVYTCTFLSYDQVFPPVRRTPGVDYVLFSDSRPRFLGGWEWRPLPKAAQSMTQTMANRYCKFFPHRLFPEAEISLYVDGNTLILANLSPLITEFRASGAGIGLFVHKERENLLAEFAWVQRTGKIPPEEAGRAAEQLARYRAAGVPPDHVITENGIILRRHGDPDLGPAMDLWWNELCTYTQRDQLSLPYVLHTTRIAKKIWDWNYKYRNSYFLRYPHRSGFAVDLAVALRSRMLRGRRAYIVYGIILYVLRFASGNFKPIKFWRGTQ
jgi:hypothetical protein